MAVSAYQGSILSLARMLQSPLDRLTKFPETRRSYLTGRKIWNGTPVASDRCRDKAQLDGSTVANGFEHPRFAIHAPAPVSPLPNQPGDVQLSKIAGKSRERPNECADDA